MIAWGVLGADWKNRQTSSDGLVLGAWGKTSPATYEYPASGATSTPRNPLEHGEPAGASSPARDLVRRHRALGPWGCGPGSS